MTNDMTKMANVANMCSFLGESLETHPADRRFSYGHFVHATWAKTESCPRRSGIARCTSLEQSNLHFTCNKMTLTLRFAIVAILMMWSPNTCTQPLPVVYGLIHIPRCYIIGQVTYPVLGSWIVQTHSIAHHNFAHPLVVNILYEFHPTRRSAIYR